MGNTDFSDQFRKIIIRYKRIGYDLNVIRQSTYLAINPITVDIFAALFNYTPVDRASDSMMFPVYLDDSLTVIMRTEQPTKRSVPLQKPRVRLAP